MRLFSLPTIIPIIFHHSQLPFTQRNRFPINSSIAFYMNSTQTATNVETLNRIVKTRHFKRHNLPCLLMAFTAD